jgi:two-component system response regulator RegX3
MKYDCLIVDDEVALSESTCEYFNMFDVATAWVPDADACQEFLKNNQVDLILLDVNLDGESGFSLCKSLRKDLNIPIIFISARGGDDDVLLALNIGGDDYIQKPYSLSVLLAKVKAVLKRYTSDASVGDNAVTFGKFTIDFHAGRVFRDGEDVNLKSMEYKLLAYLVRNRGRVIPKEELFSNVWGDAITGDGTLNVHVRHLREKIEEDATEPVWIVTIWGTGYMFKEGLDSGTSPGMTRGEPGMTRKEGLDCRASLAMTDGDEV